MKKITERGPSKNFRWKFGRVNVKMLDFLLVLGQIPGTHIQMSFQGLIIGILGAWLTIRIYRRPALRRKYAYWLRLTIFYIRHFRTLRRLQN